VSTNERRELISQLRSIETTLTTGVGIRLGQWAGLGDWSALTDDSCNRAASRALAELGTAITQLAALRGRLAGLLGPDRDTAPAGPDEPTEDAGEVSFTLEQQFGDALGAMFPRDLHEIASSDAYGALKYKVLHRCQDTGETPAEVLATVSATDRAFVANANNPSAFLASRIESCPEP
jgi:hypothetical protein